MKVFRFSVSCLLLSLLPSPSPSFSSILSSFLSSSSGPSLLLPVRPHPPTPTPRVPRRTSTTNIHASFPCRASTATSRSQCSTRNLHHNHPCPISPRRGSTATIHAQFSLSGINCNRSKMCTAASHPPESACSVTDAHKECQRMLNEKSDRISKYTSVRIENQIETYVLTCPDMPWWKFMYCIKACNNCFHKYSSLYCFPCFKSHYLPAFLRSRTSVV